MSSTAGVEQKSPSLTPGQENRDFSDAINKSQARVSWNPAAAAIPFTTHKVGTGKYLNLSINYAQESNIYLGFLDALSYLRSCPELKTDPYPSKITIFIFFSATFFSVSVNAYFSCFIAFEERVFLFFGFVIVIWADFFSSLNLKAIIFGELEQKLYDMRDKASLIMI